MRVPELMSRLAAARKLWFDLIETLEQTTNCAVEDRDLEGLIDSEFSGRDTLTEEEAKYLLIRAARRPKPPLERTGT